MQIVIDIDDNLYTRLFDTGDEYVADMRRACVAIRKGIPLDKIRTDITAIVINGQVDEHTAFIRTGEQVKQMALDVIDKYKAETGDKG